MTRVLGLMIKHLLLSEFGRSGEHCARGTGDIDPLDSEIRELSEISELQVSSLGNLNLDCLIIVDDMGMELGRYGGKESLDVSSIQLKLEFPMFENE